MILKICQLLHPISIQKILQRQHLTLEKTDDNPNGSISVLPQNLDFQNMNFGNCSEYETKLEKGIFFIFKGEMNCMQELNKRENSIFSLL